MLILIIFLGKIYPNFSSSPFLLTGIDEPLIGFLGCLISRKYHYILNLDPASSCCILCVYFTSILRISTTNVISYCTVSVLSILDIT